MSLGTVTGRIRRTPSGGYRANMGGAARRRKPRIPGQSSPQQPRATPWLPGAASYTRAPSIQLQGQDSPGTQSLGGGSHGPYGRGFVDAPYDVQRQMAQNLLGAYQADNTPGFGLPSISNRGYTAHWPGQAESGPYDRQVEALQRWLSQPQSQSQPTPQPQPTPGMRWQDNETLARRQLGMGNYVGPQPQSQYFPGMGGYQQQYEPLPMVDPMLAQSTMAFGYPGVWW